MLELAAKAAGYWSDEFKCVDKLPFASWGPLTNDGDAFNLVVTLRLHTEPLATMGGKPLGWRAWPAGRGDCDSSVGGVGAAFEVRR